MLQERFGAGSSGRGTTSGHKTRALRHFLNYVTSTKMQANYISTTELEAELLKVNYDNAKWANRAAATDDLLQMLRETPRPAMALRLKKYKDGAYSSEAIASMTAKAQTLLLGFQPRSMGPLAGKKAYLLN